MASGYLTILSPKQEKHQEVIVIFGCGNEKKKKKRGSFKRSCYALICIFSIFAGLIPINGLFNLMFLNGLVSVA